MTFTRPRAASPTVRAAGACLALAAILLLPATAAAYVGPGAGFAFVTSFFLLLSTGLLTLLALLTWPFRALYRLIRRKRRPGPIQIDRAVVVGLDGLDPGVVRGMLEQGRLPSFSRLAASGVLGELATTCPAISPVAWSTFATGVDPSRHGIFDFLTRDPRDYTAILSSTEVRPPRRSIDLGPWRIPLGKPSYRLLRRSVPFWRILGEHGVRTSVLRVPITFPPEPFDGTLLSGMCAPDLLGTQGTYLQLSSARADLEERPGGRTVLIEPGPGGLARRGEAEIPGPPHPLRRDGRPLRCKVTIWPDPGKRRATLRVGGRGGRKVVLEQDRYSDWTEVPFALAPGIVLRGVCRFRLLSFEPLRIYATPLNIDPARPAMPLGHPFTFPIFLAKLIGRYSTLGLAEDTSALNDGVIDEAAFLEQCQLFHEERERMFFQVLRRHRRGACVCVFDITDRVQHMFMGARERGEGPGAGAIEALYEQMDRMLGRIIEEVGDDPRALLLVLSDHGFAPFSHGVNLNTWLQQRGYLALRPGQARCGDYLEGVDWSATRAFALGLSGIYLNLAGREAHGVVPPGEAASLRAELRAGLLELRAPESDEPVVREVFDRHERYNGPFVDSAPDLLVGYHRGYRASWATARGGSGEAVVEPNTRHWTGDHCIDPRLVPGVLLSNRPLRAEGARIEDVAPTLLELFGVPRPAHMTGRSLAGEEAGS